MLLLSSSLPTHIFFVAYAAPESFFLALVLSVFRLCDAATLVCETAFFVGEINTLTLHYSTIFCRLHLCM